MSEYTRKVYGIDLTDQQVAHQVTCYIGQCSCGLLVKWHQSCLGKTEDGMRFFEENCECGACSVDDSEDKGSDNNDSLYQSFKAGYLSANDGIFPDAFEDDIRVLFDEFERGLK